ncbi:EutN/CcmL family microcompartment protein [Thermoactinomyces mirandus]|uniref:EutN/CcmL family microcompartment protein n=1 Tax=Thermoactinomyces mirandus TaxID=2756294 RepID=A0A7W1XU12_9BACL|nr:EutN/CcmL family microcompartment protein [Thermoactinomyces mirandus]MBA4603269.1 EutN/CcmL family microcompartment protein [Thermoactinomyces mirandus]
MYIGRVIGNVVATTKDSSLKGKKMLIVEKLNIQSNTAETSEVAIDTVGAGNGEYVLVTKGSSARVSSGMDSAVDAAIVAIIDSIEIEK